MKNTNKFISLILLILCCNVAYSLDSNTLCNKAKMTSRSNGCETLFIEQIITNEQGVFLLVNDFWVCSQGLHASRDGMLVLVSGEWMTLLDAIEYEDCIRASWKCRKCGRYSMDGVNTCPYCGKPKNG